MHAVAVLTTRTLVRRHHFNILSCERWIVNWICELHRAFSDFRQDEWTRTMVKKSK